MRSTSNNPWRWLIISVVILLVAANLPALAQASPPAQEPRPPIDTGGGGTGGGNGGDNGGSTVSRCASVVGQVINWGYGPQDNIGAELKTGSWQAATTSASDGNYGLGSLGVGVATLRVAVPPAQARQLHPLIQDAGIYLSCQYPVIANLAVYSGSRIDPPAFIDMAAPEQTITPGNKIDLTLTVKNTLPTDISNVIITDMMPVGLTAFTMTSSLKPADIRIVEGGADGQLAVAYFDKLKAGAKVNLTFTVKVGEDVLGGTKIKNTATLFYRESAADQAWVDLAIGSGETPVPAASTAAEAEAGKPPVTPVTEVEKPATPQSTAVAPVSGKTATPEKEASASSDFVPPGNMPVTGTDLSDSLVAAAKPASSVSAPIPADDGLSTLASDNRPAQPPAAEPAQTSAVNQSSLGLPITVVVAVLFLGLLVFGSGLKLARHPED